MVEIVAVVCTLDKLKANPKLDALRASEPVFSGKIAGPKAERESDRAVQSFSVEPILQNAVFDVKMVRRGEEAQTKEGCTKQLTRTLVKDFNLLFELLDEGDEIWTRRDRAIRIREGHAAGGVDVKMALRDHILIDKERAEQCDVAPGDVAILRSSEFLAMREYTSLRRYV